MDSQKYIDYILNTIKPFAKMVSGGREINCRCFYCSDSVDMRKGHFYISVPKNDEPSYFYCQKCKSKGIVTEQKLIEWDLYDPSVAMYISLYNKQIMKLAKNRKFKDSEIYHLNNTVIHQDNLSEYKIAYINKRIGSSLTYEDCLKQKIVLNLTDIFKCNYGLSYTRHPNIIEQLDSNFIGFLSFDNSFLNMRNLEIGELYHTINKRYVNYNIFDKYDNTHRFYTIPTDIDLLKPIKLHIAEGSFDILSIYHNLRLDHENNIFTSIGGSGYMGIIRFFISTLKLVNLEIHIYPDNDISRDQMVHIARSLYPFGMDIYIHRNNYPGEKDFGVPLNKINESIEKLI